MAPPVRSKLLILDLDETLIHASEVPLEREADFRVGHYHVYRRPYLNTFVERVRLHFELAVWSSATRPYVAEVVREIFGSEPELAFIWARDRCTLCFDPELRDYYWRKHLRMIRRKGYRVEEVLVVDDTPQKWERSYGNLVCVRPFTGHPDDELLHLAAYLETLAEVPNVRTVEKRGWRTLVSRAKE